MTKTTFHQKNEFKRWLSKASKLKKYALYLSLKRYQLVAEPQVSTSPVRFGIYENKSIAIDELQKLGQSWAKQYHIPFYTVTDYEFSDSIKV